MRILNITSCEFENLERLHLIEGILEKESDMYYLPNSKSEIVKVYKYYRNRLYIMSKLRAIKNLHIFTNELDFPELLTSSGIMKIDGKIVGPIYPKITGYTARIYLNTLYTPIETKIEILREIGALLERIKNTNPEYNAAFADVHVDNFIVNGIPYDNVTDVSNLSITACDTDSMKILDSPGIPGFYLYDSDKLGGFSKYELDSDNYVKPNSNTDIYCFIMMILDLISKSEFVYSLNPDEYKRYIDYLDKIGFDSNLLTSFASVYEDDKDNITPLPYLKSLTKISDESTLLSFYKNRSR